MDIQNAYNEWSDIYDTNTNLTRDLDSTVTRSLLANRRFDSILELGCGTGKNTVFFAEIGKQAKAGTAKDKDKALLGQKIYRGGIQGSGVPACASCHGANGQGIPVQFPRLAGQHADYTVTQLNGFRSGERANDAAKMMRMIAAKMTPQDMEAVAQYIQGLR